MKLQRLTFHRPNSELLKEGVDDADEGPHLELVKPRRLVAEPIHQILEEFDDRNRIFADLVRILTSGSVFT